MFKNYLRSALRNLLRHRIYAALNIAGLALGMACCLLIFRYVAFQLSFDRFHEQADQIYLGFTHEAGNAAGSNTYPRWPHLLGPTIAQERPEVERFARVLRGRIPVVSSVRDPGQVFSEERLVFADPALLEMFSFPLVEGDADAALTEPGTLLLSESTARKYFGTENPIGKTLKVNVLGLLGSYKVWGVMRDVPENSHLQFDFLLPMQDLLTNMKGQNFGGRIDNGWTHPIYTTYLQLRPGARVAEIEQTLTQTFRDHLPAEASRQASWRMALSPLQDVYLHTEEPGRPYAIITVGSARIVSFATVLGLFILVLAWVNYVNLTTARSLQRAREVGVRKVVGASRLQLMRQFLLESALVNAAAFVLALGLSEILLPLVENMAGISLPDQAWGHTPFWAAAGVLFVVGTVLAGLYPAFVLSSFRPAPVLKGSVGRLGSRLVLRKALIVFQFTVSVVLLVGLSVTQAQLDHMRAYDLGIELERMLVVKAPTVFEEMTGEFMVDIPRNNPALKRFKADVEALPAVRAGAMSVNLPGQGFNWKDIPARRAGSDPSANTSVSLAVVGHDFIPTFELELLAGRNFSEEMGMGTLILTETVAHALGFTSPGEAVGQSIEWEYENGTRSTTVVGVVKDFHWSTLQQAREPVVLMLSTFGVNYGFRVVTERLPETLAAIETTFKKAFPGNAFEYYFLDESFDERYKQEERFAALFGLFAALAVLIACLGLFGLAAFAAQQRTKEIGVRKVLGASVGALVVLLSKEFVRLVLVAVAVASPLAYVGMSRWLDGFAYRIVLGPGAFVMAGGAALVIALLTVSFQAVKAALANPVKSLRYE